MLLNRLLLSFGGQVLQHLSPLPDAHANKHPHRELSEDDSELDAEQEEDMEADAATDREQDQQEPEFDFATLSTNFSKKGRWWQFFLTFFSSVKWLKLTVKMKPKSAAWRKQGLPPEGAVFLDGHSKQIATPSLLKLSLPGT